MGRQALVLDSEALYSLAHQQKNKNRASRVLVYYKAALRNQRSVIAPPLVVAELCRGHQYDPAILRAINSHGLIVSDIDLDEAVNIGNLLGSAGLDSAHMVDASVVCAAARVFGSQILTGDIDDIKNLINHADNSVRVVSI